MYITDITWNIRKCCILQMYGDGCYGSSMEGVIFHWTCQKWIWGTQSSYRREPT